MMSAGIVSRFFLCCGSGSAPTCRSSSDFAPLWSRRRFCSESSFLSFRSCTLVASRLRRDSCAPIPFLKADLRSSMRCMARYVRRGGAASEFAGPRALTDEFGALVSFAARHHISQNAARGKKWRQSSSSTCRRTWWNASWSASSSRTHPARSADVQGGQVAARNAIKVRQFSGEVHTFEGHTEGLAQKNTFELHTDYVMALVALPDNQHALSGSLDRTVKLFNVDDGAVLRTFSTTQKRALPGAAADGLRFVSSSSTRLPPSSSTGSRCRGATLMNWRRITAGSHTYARSYFSRFHAPPPHAPKKFHTQMHASSPVEMIWRPSGLHTAALTSCECASPTETSRVSSVSHTWTWPAAVDTRRNCLPPSSAAAGGERSTQLIRFSASGLEAGHVTIIETGSASQSSHHLTEPELSAVSSSCA